MPSADSLKKWKKFGLNEKTEICRLNVADLIIALGDKNSGFVGTYHDILNEKFSHSYSQPAQVCWIREEDKFLVTDGYHRILQRMLKGKASFLCEIDWSGYSLKWYLPTLNERFNLNMLRAFKKQPTRSKQMKITKTYLKQLIREAIEEQSGAGQKQRAGLATKLKEEYYFVPARNSYRNQTRKYLAKFLNQDKKLKQQLTTGKIIGLYGTNNYSISAVWYEDSRELQKVEKATMMRDFPTPAQMMFYADGFADLFKKDQEESRRHAMPSKFGDFMRTQEMLSYAKTKDDSYLESAIYEHKFKPAKKFLEDSGFVEVSLPVGSSPGSLEKYYGISKGQQYRTG